MPSQTYMHRSISLVVYSQRKIIVQTHAMFHPPWKGRASILFLVLWPPLAHCTWSQLPGKRGKCIDHHNTMRIWWSYSEGICFSSQFSREAVVRIHIRTIFTFSSLISLSLTFRLLCTTTVPTGSSVRVHVRDVPRMIWVVVKFS